MGLRVYMYPPEDTPRTPQGASDRMIRSLNSKKFKPSLMCKEDPSCAICLSDYIRGESIRFLPCNHHFHAKFVFFLRCYWMI